MLAVGVLMVLALAGCGGGDGLQQIAVDNPSTPPTVELGHLEIKALSVSPETVDATNSDQVVTITMAITDTNGLELKADYSWYAPIRGAAGELYWGFMTRVAGDAKNGVYAARVTIPKQSASGTMKVERVDLWDVQGSNRTYQYAELKALGFAVDIQNATADKTPPHLHNGVTIAPDRFSVVTQDQTVTVDCAVQDNSDVGDGSRTVLRLTSGGAVIEVKNFTVIPPLYGRPYAYLHGTAIFPKGTPAGTWRVEFLKIRDAAGNESVYTYADLTARGYSSGLDITLE